MTSLRAKVQVNEGRNRRSAEHCEGDQGSHKEVGFDDRITAYIDRRQDQIDVKDDPILDVLPRKAA